MQREMQRVFDAAIVKAKIRSSKKGNTCEPWKDFTVGRLCNRMEEEIEEWNESNDRSELLDIINFAAFLYLSFDYAGKPTEPKEGLEWGEKIQ